MQLRTHLAGCLGRWLVLLGTWGTTAGALVGESFEESIRPILVKYCIDCHSADERKGDLDLDRFDSLAAVRQDISVWEAVRDQLDLGEMPPAKKRQPSPAERELLNRWLHGTLAEEAQARAGDPGPVVLRRFSNAELTHTLRDLTGLASLDPAREFPVDGAAGEGFTNTGAALSMSPSLVTKYLDAAKEVARHAVLLPDGIGFSESTTARDWTEEKMAAIRSIYSRHAVPGEGMSVNLQGLRFDFQDGMVLPLEPYFLATLAEREALAEDPESFVRIAAERGLSAKYLTTLWTALHDSRTSTLLDPLRRQWRAATPEDAASLADWVKRQQPSLWAFHPIGQIGKVNGPRQWQEPLVPLAPAREVRLKFPATAADAVRLSLVTSDAGGTGNPAVVWENARLLRENRPPVFLNDVPRIVSAVNGRMAAELGRTALYLDALAEAVQSDEALDGIATRRNLDAGLLNRWAEFAGVGRRKVPEITGHFTDRLVDIGGHATYRGWGSAQTPSIAANASAETIQVSTTNVPGRAVLVHPSPSQAVEVGWRSPLEGTIRLAGRVADRDGNCGNGIEWRVEVAGQVQTTKVAGGIMENGGTGDFASTGGYPVNIGDVVRITVAARAGDHVCDTTQLELVVSETTGEKRVWSLEKDVVDSITDGNPLADSDRNPNVWHFCGIPDPSPPTGAAADSRLAKWGEALARGATREELHTLAVEIQTLAVEASAGEGADASLRAAMLDWDGLLGWLASAAVTPPEAVDGIRTAASPVREFEVPAQLAAGTEFAATARLDMGGEPDGCARIHATLTPTDGNEGEFLVADGGRERDRLAADIAAFQQLFPAALCYSKIVPADETVTLRLFHREDEPLRRLVLDDADIAGLDRLWSELRFISQEPLRLVDAFEQLYQFATQDGDPGALEPMREGILTEAARFREELVAAEASHLQATIGFAARAWRRPLAETETERLRTLYRTLRGEGLEHEETVRLLIARILTAPAFLYKLEEAGKGTEPTPVDNHALATRLSYFLWSSAPDPTLRDLARDGKLNDPDVLADQARRMTADPKIRRLAIEFGCQWLHVRDFDQHDGKSERIFPGFAAIRGALNEEPIRFFTDLFQRDGPVTDLLEADHTFVNGELAEYYGIAGVEGDAWTRVENVRASGRGGVLGFGAVLASQSGASRTSPILRGNWICETLLGEKLPRPPKDVPVLPDEAPQGLSERQLTERHSSDPACARCHVRMDPFGFSLENYDAIGRFRSGDTAEQPIDSRARTADGTEFAGIEGLRSYVLSRRHDEFVRQFCRKLLGYALGRQVRLSDAPLLDAMQEKLAAGHHRVGIVIEMIVRSPQFRNIRGRDFPGSH